MVGDSLLPSENHEAIPCIERAPRAVDGGRGDGIGARSSSRELASGSARGGEGTGRVNTRKPKRPRERRSEKEGGRGRDGDEAGEESSDTRLSSGTQIWPACARFSYVYERRGESARYTSYWKTIMRVLTVALPPSTPANARETENPPRNHDRRERPRPWLTPRLCLVFFFPAFVAVLRQIECRESAIRTSALINSLPFLSLSRNPLIEESIVPRAGRSVFVAPFRKKRRTRSLARAPFFLINSRPSIRLHLQPHVQPREQPVSVARVAV